MKVYYDYQILHHQSYGGISRYYFDLLSTIKKLDLCDFSIDAPHNRCEYFEPFFHVTPEPQFTGSRLAQYIKRFKEDYQSKKQVGNILKSKQYSIVCPTYFDPYIIRTAKKNGVKIVLTVYDMIHELMPEQFCAGFLNKLSYEKTIRQKKRMILSADHIIAISNNTKNDILKLFPGIPECKISVIYIGNNLVPDLNSAKKISLPQRYILYVGRRSGYKNFSKFACAVKSIFDSDSSLHLVCAGGPPLSLEEKALFGDEQSRVIKIDADDETLKTAYSNALCFVFPSLYEGFGIPTLESFACDCPAVISRTSSMPEVGGDAVEYFNPTNSESIKEAICNVVYNAEYTAELKKRGKDRLKMFSWDSIAEAVVECYRNVVQ